MQTTVNQKADIIYSNLTKHTHSRIFFTRDYFLNTSVYLRSKSPQLHSSAAHSNCRYNMSDNIVLARDLYTPRARMARARLHKNVRTTAIASLLTKPGARCRRASSRHKRGRDTTHPGGRTIGGGSAFQRWQRRWVAHAREQARVKEETAWRREKETRARAAKRYAGSHTLITRMLYACWWDTYVWALLSKLCREGIHEYRRGSVTRTSAFSPANKRAALSRRRVSAPGCNRKIALAAH